jgi:hypothetical protein
MAQSGLATGVDLCPVSGEERTSIGHSVLVLAGIVEAFDY